MVIAASLWWALLGLLILAETHQRVSPFVRASSVDGSDSFSGCNEEAKGQFCHFRESNVWVNEVCRLRDGRGVVEVLAPIDSEGGEYFADLFSESGVMRKQLVELSESDSPIDIITALPERHSLSSTAQSTHSPHSPHSPRLPCSPRRILAQVFDNHPTEGCYQVTHCPHPDKVPHRTHPFKQAHRLNHTIHQIGHHEFETQSIAAHQTPTHNLNFIVGPTDTTSSGRESFCRALHFVCWGDSWTHIRHKLNRQTPFGTAIFESIGSSFPPPPQSGEPPDGARPGEVSLAIIGGAIGFLGHYGHQRELGAKWGWEPRCSVGVSNPKQHTVSLHRFTSIKSIHDHQTPLRFDMDILSDSSPTTNASGEVSSLAISIYLLHNGSLVHLETSSVLTYPTLEQSETRSAPTVHTQLDLLTHFRIESLPDNGCAWLHGVRRSHPFVSHSPPSLIVDHFCWSELHTSSSPILSVYSPQHRDSKEPDDDDTTTPAAPSVNVGRQRTYSLDAAVVPRALSPPHSPSPPHTSHRTISQNPQHTSLKKQHFLSPRLGFPLNTKHNAIHCLKDNDINAEAKELREVLPTDAVEEMLIGTFNVAVAVGASAIGVALVVLLAPKLVKYENPAPDYCDNIEGLLLFRCDGSDDGDDDLVDEEAPSPHSTYPSQCGVNNKNGGQRNGLHHNNDDTMDQVVILDDGDECPQVKEDFDHYCDWSDKERCRLVTLPSMSASCGGQGSGDTSLMGSDETETECNDKTAVHERLTLRLGRQDSVMMACRYKGDRSARQESGVDGGGDTSEVEMDSGHSHRKINCSWRYWPPTASFDNIARRYLPRRDSDEGGDAFLEGGEACEGIAGMSDEDDDDSEYGSSGVRGRETGHSYFMDVMLTFPSMGVGEPLPIILEKSEFER
eukprot:GHVN01041065.1.p1 GENE.GHVN01041065.1~~GHVN01041065.1.p1  ORF type:complete len:900 (+),score=208.56 GHVN01041065.1:421-3120(+)